MLFTSKLKALSIIVVTGSLMVGFQNCAKYSYQDVVASTDTPNDTLSSDELPDNTITPIDQTQPPQAGQPNPPSQEIPPVEEPPTNELPPIGQPPVAELPPGTQPPSNELPPAPQPPVAELPPVTQPPVTELPPVQQPPVAELPPVVEPPSNELPPVPQPPVLPPPVAENPVVPITPPGLPPVTPPEDQECIEWALDKKDKKHDQGKKDLDDKDKKYSKNENSKDNGKEHDKKSEDKNQKSAGRNSFSSNDATADISCDKKDREEKLIVKKPRCYVEDEDDNDDEDYDTTCDVRSIQRAKYVNSISAALNVVGLRGKFVISPETVGSNSISKLEDLRGKIVICRMDIDSVNHTRGKVVAYKSNIGVWQDHRGKSVIVDSRIDKCVDHKGKIDIKGSNAVCNSIQNSKGVVTVSRNGQ